jgi:hypothetical protein
VLVALALIHVFGYVDLGFEIEGRILELVSAVGARANDADSGLD